MSQAFSSFSRKRVFFGDFNVELSLFCTDSADSFDKFSSLFLEKSFVAADPASEWLILKKNIYR